MSVLNPGAAQGAVMLLDEPLSFWGAFDPASGIIIDVHHPQRGRQVTGKIVMMAETRGSGSASGAFAEAIRLGTGPAGVVLVKPDVNLAIGAGVAATLYGKSVPVIAVPLERFLELSRAAYLHISHDGMIAPGPAPVE